MEIETMLYAYRVSILEVSAASISHRQLIIHQCPAFADEVGGEIVAAKDNFHPNYSVCQSVKQGFQV